MLSIESSCLALIFLNSLGPIERLVAVVPDDLSPILRMAVNGQHVLYGVPDAGRLTGREPAKRHGTISPNDSLELRFVIGIPLQVSVAADDAEVLAICGESLNVH